MGLPFLIEQSLFERGVLTHDPFRSSGNGSSHSWAVSAWSLGWPCGARCHFGEVVSDTILSRAWRSTNES